MPVSNRPDNPKDRYNMLLEIRVDPSDRDSLNRGNREFADPLRPNRFGVERLLHRVLVVLKTSREI